jgi:hypothetical protein
MQLSISVHCLFRAAPRSAETRFISLLLALYLSLRRLVQFRICNKSQFANYGNVRAVHAERLHSIDFARLWSIKKYPCSNKFLHKFDDAFVLQFSIMFVFVVHVVDMCARAEKARPVQHNQLVQNREKLQEKSNRRLIKYMYPS